MLDHNCSILPFSRSCPLYNISRTVAFSLSVALRSCSRRQTSDRNTIWTSSINKKKRWFCIITRWFQYICCDTGQQIILFSHLSSFKRSQIPNSCLRSTLLYISHALNNFSAATCFVWLLPHCEGKSFCYHLFLLRCTPYIQSREPIKNNRRRLIFVRQLPAQAVYNAADLTLFYRRRRLSLTYKTIQYVSCWY